MTNKQRIEIANKYNSKCAYCGKELDTQWQIDHMIPVLHMNLGLSNIGKNNIDNLVPVMGIINHYKRVKDLEAFRKYLLTFHIRLSKLPKNPRTEKTKKRIRYMNTIAELFGITPENPFTGKFYFETLKT